jgi:hypothetical protein
VHRSEQNPVGRLQTTLASFFARVSAVVEFVTVKTPKSHKDQQIRAKKR